MDRYEEALKKAKMYHRNAKAAGDYADVARYENIFPELGESEEETTRKELLDFVRSFWADHKEKLPQASRWVTYLEKQKEPENVSASTMAPACWEVELKKQEVGHLYPEDYPMTPEECIKPAEWSEEDENMFDDILLDMADRREMFKSEGETTFAEDTQKKIDWLSSHHLQLKYQSSCPQPKQEWSEEDEKMIRSILFVLESYVSKAECKQSPTLTATYPTYYKEIDWLKSLRSHPKSSDNWKPSEEQMEALSYAIDDYTDFKENDQRDALQSIYEQLKKL